MDNGPSTAALLMSEWTDGAGQAALDLAVGFLIITVFLVQRWFGRAGIPALIGFILVGLALRGMDQGYSLISDRGLTVLEFFGHVGLIALLFRVGLESDIHSLADKLPRAVPVWLGDVIISGGAGLAGAYFWLDLDLVPSLFVATALSATSAAVSASVWQDAKRLNDADGQLMLDVVELDDVSGVILMMALLAVAPVMLAGNTGDISALVTAAGLSFLIKTLIFGAVCLALAKYGEHLIRRALTDKTAPDSILIVLGTGIVIAGVSASLGFSLAIGAFFAGLIFSRDPAIVKMETLFLPLHAFFAPFFFISIGLEMDPSLLGPGLAVGGALAIVAVAGKMIGGALPAYWVAGTTGAATIGVSLIPRAEVTLVIMAEGRELGPAAVPDEIYAGTIVVVLVTCAVTPLILRALFRRPTSNGD